MKKSRTVLGVVWLTLVAFGIQLGVSVAHHHRNIGGATDPAGVALSGICNAGGPHACSPDEERHARNDGCLLCWATAIAANALEPPHVLPAPIPTQVITARLDGYDNAPLDRLHRDHFHARGPPVLVLM